MSEALKDQLRTIISDVSEVETIPDETPFKELGIDSMMAMEIISEVERKFKISIPEDELKTMTHLTAVYSLVEKKIAAQA